MKLLGLFRALGSSSIFETKPRLFTLYLVVLADGKHNLWAFASLPPLGAAAYAISNCVSVKADNRPGTRNIETRSKLRLEIWRRVERITFWSRRSADSPRLIEDPANDLFPFAEVRFANGKCRYIVFTKGMIMMLP